MNKVIIGLLALTTLGSGGWALYERGQNEEAVKRAELAEARALETEKQALMAQELARKAMIRSEEARAEMERCCNQRK